MNQITIDLPTETYLPGEVVKGTVNLSIDKTVKARNVKLGIIGLEKTRVTVNSGKYSTTYRETNHIIKEEVILKGPDYDKNLELHPGNFTFTFEFKIPENAPPSYKGLNASITYELNSRVDVPMWKDIVDKKSFIVSKKRKDMDLLTQPANFQSDNFSQPNDKKPGFSVELKKVRYVIGEVIEGSITLQNMAASKIRKIDIKLLGVEYARAQRHSRNVTLNKEKIEIPIHEIFEQMPKQFNLPIPKEVPPSYECKLSNFRWAIEVGLDIALRKDVKTQFNVEIF